VRRRARAASTVDRGHHLDELAVGDRAELQVPFGERAGLVEAQHVNPSECLENSRVADEHAPLGEAVGGPGLRDRREERQPFGDRGGGQAHAGRHRLAHPYTAQHARPHEHAARREHERHRRAGQMFQAGLDTARRRARALRDPAACLGAVAGRHHDRLTAARRDRGAREGHRATVGDRGLERDRVPVLGDRQ
jgi:hypothetical protein